MPPSKEAKPQKAHPSGKNSRRGPPMPPLATTTSSGRTSSRPKQSTTPTSGKRANVPALMVPNSSTKVMNFTGKTTPKRTPDIISTLGLDDVDIPPHSADLSTLTSNKVEHVSLDSPSALRSSSRRGNMRDLTNLGRPPSSRGDGTTPLALTPNTTNLYADTNSADISTQPTTIAYKQETLKEKAVSIDDKPLEQPEGDKNPIPSNRPNARGSFVLESIKNIFSKRPSETANTNDPIMEEQVKITALDGIMEDGELDDKVRNEFRPERPVTPSSFALDPKPKDDQNSNKSNKQQYGPKPMSSVPPMARPTFNGGISVPSKLIKKRSSFSSQIHGKKDIHLPSFDLESDETIYHSGNQDTNFADISPPEAHNTSRTSDTLNRTSTAKSSLFGIPLGRVGSTETGTSVFSQGETSIDDSRKMSVEAPIFDFSNETQGDNNNRDSVASSAKSSIVFETHSSKKSDASKKSHRETHVIAEVPASHQSIRDINPYGVFEPKGHSKKSSASSSTLTGQSYSIEKSYSLYDSDPNNSIISKPGNTVLSRSKSKVSFANENDYYVYDELGRKLNIQKSENMDPTRSDIYVTDSKIEQEFPTFVNSELMGTMDKDGFPPEEFEDNRKIPDDTYIALNAGKLIYTNRKYTDKVAAIVFILNLFVTIFLAIFMLIYNILNPKHVDFADSGNNGNDDLSIAQLIARQVNGIPVIHWIVGPIVCMVGTSILSSFFYVIYRRMPKATIITGYVAFSTFLLLAAVGFYVIQDISSGVVVTVWFILFMLLFSTVFKKLTFVSVVLTEAFDMASKFKGLFRSLAVVCVIQCFLFCVWTIAFSTGTVFFGNEKKNISVIILYVYLLFSLMWMSEMATAILRMISGNIMCVYYCFSRVVRHSREPIISNKELRRSPVLKAFEYATTKSFGSAAKGSIILLLIEFCLNVIYVLRVFCAIPIISYILRPLDRLLASIQVRLEEHSKLAFIRCAVYGESFSKASKRASKVIRSRAGFIAPVRDTSILTAQFCARASMMVASAAWGGILAYAQIAQLPVSHYQKFIYCVWMMAISIVSTYLLTRTICEFINSIISASYLNLAEHPEMVAVKHPGFASTYKYYYKTMDYGNGFRMTL